MNRKIASSIISKQANPTIIILTLPTFPKSLYTKITFRNSQSRRPFMLKNVQTNCSICADIWMVNLCFEPYFWWFKRILFWEGNTQVKYSSFIWRIFRSRNCSLPIIRVFIDWTCINQRWRMTYNVCKLLKSNKKIFC